MKKYIKILLVGVVFIILVFWGHSQYDQAQKKLAQKVYVTAVETPSGNLLLGGMSAAKGKMDAFKKDLEKDKNYWVCIHSASRYEKLGDYKNAILEREKAIGFAEIESDVWQARAGMGRLYEMLGDNSRAIEEYDWLIVYQTKILDEAIAENNKIDISYREKIVNELKEARKKAESKIK